MHFQGRRQPDVWVTQSMALSVKVVSTHMPSCVLKMINFFRLSNELIFGDSDTFTAMIILAHKLYALNTSHSMIGAEAKKLVINFWESSETLFVGKSTQDQFWELWKLIWSFWFSDQQLFQQEAQL